MTEKELDEVGHAAAALALRNYWHVLNGPTADNAARVTVAAYLDATGLTQEVERLRQQVMALDTMLRSDTPAMTLAEYDAEYGTAHPVEGAERG